MLTKITTSLLILALVVIGWMAVSHSSDLKSERDAAQAAKHEAEVAAEAKRQAELRAQQAENANRSNKNTIAGLTSELGTQRLLVEQEKERARSIQARYDDLTTRYSEALQNDPKTRDWASTALPDAIASGRLLYHPTLSAARPGGGDAAGGAQTPAADPVPRPAGQAPAKR